jgi:hypothetical protein
LLLGSSKPLGGTQLIVMQSTAFTTGARFGVTRKVGAARTPSVRRAAPIVRAAAAQEEMVDELGYKLMRKGVKVAAADTILTPRCCRGRDGSGWQPLGPRIGPRGPLLEVGSHTVLLERLQSIPAPSALQPYSGAKALLQLAASRAPGVGDQWAKSV